jgi:D-amino-acid dehydrogenase
LSEERVVEGGTQDIAIIGAGIVGLASALYLQQDGHRVTLFDPSGPGEGATFGNAGCLNGSSVVPMAMPGMLRNVPRWLMDPMGPLAIRWRYLPTIAPWLLRFVRAGREERVREQARALRALLAPTLDCYVPLVKAAGAEHLLHKVGHLTVYKSEDAFAKDRAGALLREANGVEVESLSFDELRQIEPELSRDYIRGRFIGETGHVGDPHRLAQLFAEAVTRQGGQVVRQRVLGFAFDDGRVVGLRSEARTHRADRILVAAGAWSKPFAAALGDAVPLDTERGYHIVLKDPEAMPRHPVGDGAGKFMATPMEMGLRLAGTVEFAGLDAPPDWRRAEILVPQLHAMFPKLPARVPPERLTRWMGFRPSLPDSLPVIGPASRHPNVVYAFGHGHVGLAGGSMTGHVVAALLGGRPPPIDMAPFRVTRF